MKIFLKTLLIATICVTIFQACGSDGNDESPAEISLSSIVGYWGISSSTEDGSTQSRVPCENTVNIQSNGDFLLILNHAGEVVEGNMSVNPADSTLTLSVNGQSETLKFVVVTGNGFQLQSTDGSGAAVNLDQFVRLNDGDCATITESNLIGQWELTEVENLEDDGGQGDDGPQVGMILDFVSGGNGDITVDGNVVLTFTFEFLDDSNIKVIFEDDQGSNSDDFNIFHIRDNQTDTTLEILIGESNPESSDDGGIDFRVVLEKQN